MQKDAIKAMPTVKSKENLQCSVCLDDFEISAEAGEMPCKHKFHNGCILPWLELHSSCPVCRFQIAADESQLDSDASQNVSSNNGHGSSEGGVRFFCSASSLVLRLFNGSDQAWKSVTNLPWKLTRQSLFLECFSLLLLWFLLQRTQMTLQF